MARSAGEYRVVAVVSAGGVRRVVKCSRPPSPREANLLFTLGEHVSRTISTEDICHRLRLSVNGLRQAAHRLRKKLHHDWIVEAVNGEGYRLCYIGSPLADADCTVVEFDPEAFKRNRAHTQETRDKIRATQIRKGAHKYFRNKRIAEEHERDLPRRPTLERETI